MSYFNRLRLQDLVPLLSFEGEKIVDRGGESFGTAALITLTIRRLKLMRREVNNFDYNSIRRS